MVRKYQKYFSYDGKSRRCRHCSFVHFNENTSNLANHMRKKHPDLYKELIDSDQNEKVQPKLTQESFSKSGNLFKLFFILL